MGTLGSRPELDLSHSSAASMSTSAEALARRYRAGLDNVVDAIVFLDASMNIVESNLAARSIVGDATTLGSTFDLIHPEDRDAVAISFTELLDAPGDSAEMRLRVLTVDGWTWVLATARNHLDDPDVAAVIVSFKDLTDEMSRRQSETMARSLVDTVPIGIVAGRQRWRADYVNSAFLDLVGAADEIVEQDWIHVLDASVAAQICSLDAPRSSDDAVATIVEWRTERATVQLDVRLNPDGSYVVTATDVTGIMSELEAERSSAAMWAHAATHDPLTGIANRALGLDRLAVAIAALPRLKRNISVTFVDMDSFKAINDQHGHHVGDAVIREVANRLTRATRAGDTVARWGGDEFVVVAQVDRNDRTPESLGKRLVDEVNAPIEVVPDHEIHLTCSMGMAVAGPTEAGARRLIEAADLAMYEAKRAAVPIQVTYLQPTGV